jgi:hypothetical protein
MVKEFKVALYWAVPSLALRDLSTTRSSGLGRTRRSFSEALSS